MTVVGDVLPALTVATAVAGTAVAATSAINQAQAQSRAAAYQAQVAKNNQITASQNAEYAIQAGQQHAEQQQAQNRALLSRTIAGEAANGVDVNSGSAVDVQATNRQTGVTDTETINHNAALQAYGYRTQGSNFGAQAGLDTMQAADATKGGNLAAFGTLAGGASSLGRDWSRMQQVGATGNSSSSDTTEID